MPPIWQLHWSLLAIVFAFDALLVAALAGRCLPDQRGARIGADCSLGLLTCGLCCFVAGRLA